MSKEVYLRGLIPESAGMLDKQIMYHVANEVRKLCLDGMSDLREYGEGEEYVICASVSFIKKGDFEQCQK